MKNKKYSLPATVFHFLPTLLWMAFIFFLSSRQTAGITGTRTQRFLFFKSLHLLEYALLFLLSLNSFTHTGIRSKRLAALLLSFAYAFSDEFHQRFVPGRQAKLSDVLIDLFGVFLALVSITLL